MAKLIVLVNAVILVVISFFSYQCFFGRAMCASLGQTNQPVSAEFKTGASSPKAHVKHKAPEHSDQAVQTDVKPSDVQEEQAVHYYFDQQNQLARIVREDAAAEPSTTSTSQHGHLVNINTASADDLSKAMKGVGPAKAQAIVDYRQAHGPFKQLNDLANVKGIGMATIEKNSALVTAEMP